MNLIVILFNILLLLTCGLILLIIWWYYIYFQYRKHLKIFPELSSIPLLGITPHLRNPSLKIYIKLPSLTQTSSKNVFGMLAFFPILLTSDPKVFSIILGSPKHINKPFVYQTMDMIKDSLLLSNGKQWHQQRKLLNPALNYPTVIQNIKVFNMESDKLVKILKDEINKESTRVEKYIESWSLHQTYSKEIFLNKNKETLMGNSDSEEDEWQFLKTIRKIMALVNKKLIRPNEYFYITYVFTKNFWREKRLVKILEDHIKTLIQKRRKVLSEGNIPNETPVLIDILLKLKETDKNITEDFIIKQLNLMLTAGYDTSATAVSFVLYNLSKNPEIQKKAYDEIYSILGDDINQIITHEHINSMIYLDLVIKESMRINTTAPVYLRKLNEDVIYEGMILPKGLTIFLLSQAMHLEPDLYPNPEEFIPERFLPENMNTNRYSYAPFAGGIRNCIGQKYAMVSMKIVLAKLLLNYELVDAQHQLHLTCEILLRSKTGINVKFRKRI